MAQMRIAEESEDYSTASFQFPNNPDDHNVPLTPNRILTEIPFQSRHYISDFRGIGAKNIVFNGTFFGSSKDTTFNDLGFHISDQNIKKLFLTDTAFYLVVGTDLREANKGRRPNFVDYVATFWTPIPYSFSNTLSTYTLTTSSSSEIELNDATGGSTGAFTNTGNAPSYVRWIITNTSGADITKVEIGDSSTIAASERTMTWEGTLQAGEILTMEFFKFADSGSGGKITQYDFTDIDGTADNPTSIPSLTGPPFVSPSSTDQSFSIILTGNTGATTVTAEFREANVTSI